MIGALHPLTHLDVVFNQLNTGKTWLYLWRVSSSGIWRRVVCWVTTDFRRNISPSSSECFPPACLLVLLNLFLRPWRWRRYVPPKRPLTLNGLHGVISQKMILFITTAVKTSNPTLAPLTLLCGSYSAPNIIIIAIQYEKGGLHYHHNCVCVFSFSVHIIKTVTPEWSRAMVEHNLTTNL
jgi:hypothetical protein